MAFDAKCIILFTDREIRQMQAEEAEAQWAHYGRTVYCNMMTEAGIEEVVTRLALQPGITTKDIARAIRVYLTTGTRP